MYEMPPSVAKRAAVILLCLFLSALIVGFTLTLGGK